MTSLDKVVMVPDPQQNTKYRCPLCRDTGMALYLTDTHTNEHAGPYATDSDAWQQFEKVQMLYAKRFEETKGKDGMSPRQFAFRFYLTIGGCTCPPEQRQMRQDTRAADRIKHMGIRFDLARFENISYETLADKCSENSPKLQAISSVKNYATAGELLGKRSLVLYGPNGTGKTGLAVLLWRYCTAPNALVEFRAMIGVIQNSYGEWAGETSKIIQAFQHVPILFLDDVGDPKLSESTDDKRDKLYQILEARHKADLPTILTTNLDRAQFREQFDLRTAQRLDEMATWIEVKGEVLR